jgi:hypothetical protein
MHLLPYMSIMLGASAAYVPLYPRTDHKEIVTAGIGAEFKSPLFYFENFYCSKANTDSSKRQIVAGRTGTNFKLTADTGSQAGKLNAEYILDGKHIKVGSGAAAKAGAAAYKDLVSAQTLHFLCFVLIY